MSRNRYQPDDHDLKQHEFNRRLEIAAEQEPAWAHYRPRNRFLGANRPGRRHRYFSGLMFRPVQHEAEHLEQADDVAA
jgi:hypothetical protein